jgi:thymidylate synthase
VIPTHYHYISKNANQKLRSNSTIPSIIRKRSRGEKMYPYYKGKILDDVMHSVIEEILRDGDRVKCTKGETIELTGVLLEVENPRARISRTETRGKPFGCLGELCWYLARSNDLCFIEYYLSRYKDYADDGVVFGGYGPRIFNFRDQNQMNNVATLLKEKPNSRRAVIQLFDALDIIEQHKDIPCTCTLQFIIRDDKLDMFTNMRSNDAYIGLPHDVFSFTMLQEIMARTLSIEIGTYKHSVGSLHIYDKNKKEAQQFLDEGYQSTIMPMPPMPIGDPWPAIDFVLSAESNIRTKGAFDINTLNGIDSYWADLVLLLQMLRYKKDKKLENIKVLSERTSSDIYRPYIESMLTKA